MANMAPSRDLQVSLQPKHKWLIGILSTLAAAWVLFDNHGVRYSLDVNVYRLGAQRLLDGLPLYDGAFHIHDEINLPFTYPPISAIIFIPLTVLGDYSLSFVMSLLNLVLLFGIVWFLLRRVGGLDRPSSTWIGAGLTAVLTFIGPTVSTLNFGQVNLVLVALILADALLVPTRFRGILTGIATSLKLTPAVFGLWFLLQKDWRSILRMGAATAGMTAIGFLILPAESTRYWFTTLRETDRIGGPMYSSNQSINAELWRLGLRTEDGGSMLWLVLVLVALAASVALMLRLFRAGQPLLALCVNGFFGLLASPVSWAHHFVWVPFFLIVLGLLAWRERTTTRSAQAPGAEGSVVNDSAVSHSAMDRFTWNISRRRVWLCLTVAGVLCFALIPTSYAPSTNNVELEWNAAWHLFGNAYLWWTLATYPALWFLFSPSARRRQQVPVTVDR